MVSESYSKSRVWPRLSVAVLVLAGLWLLGLLGARWLIVAAPLEHADAIVMLSGSSTFVERARMAAQLQRAGVAPRIVLTNDNHRGGWSQAQQRNPFYYESAVAELRRQGVDGNAIVVLQQPVSSTFDEAVLVERYASENHLNSILIVTSSYHSRRALRTFRRALGEAGREVGIVAVAPGLQSPRPATWWVSPLGWQMVPLEYFKLVYYEVSGK
jgi:uncharacterized SAM-binding protein YcdF (DUF218 family)